LPAARHPPPACFFPTLPLADKKSGPSHSLLPEITPVFVTLDPRRDSCAQVGAYVKDFHPRMLGAWWTGA
jgi:hypothetical protein